MTTTTAPATYRVLGTTDEVTECEHCGRVELKGTIILGVVDADGAVESRVHFGAVCGARAAGRPVRELRDEAAVADKEARVRRDADLAAWVRETYGVSIRTVADLGATFTRNATGLSPREVIATYRATLAAR